LAGVPPVAAQGPVSRPPTRPGRDAGRRTMSSLVSMNGRTGTRGSGWWAPIARRALAGLAHGRLTVVDGSRRDTFGGTGRADLAATVTITSPAAYRRLVLGGSLGG